MSLEHTHGRCTGSWDLVGGEIVCTSCGSTHAGTPENRMAAVDENTAGDLLQRAADRGAQLLTHDEDPA